MLQRVFHFTIVVLDCVARDLEDNQLENVPTNSVRLRVDDLYVYRPIYNEMKSFKKIFISN